MMGKRTALGSGDTHLEVLASRALWVQDMKWPMADWRGVSVERAQEVFVAVFPSFSTFRDGLLDIASMCRAALSAL
ncbi:hypothetical protein VZT92_021057 [Zoarces viviparus]